MIFQHLLATRNVIKTIKVALKQTGETFEYEVSPVLLRMAYREAYYERLIEQGAETIEIATQRIREGKEMAKYTQLVHNVEKHVQQITDSLETLHSKFQEYVNS